MKKKLLLVLMFVIAAITMAQIKPQEAKKDTSKVKTEVKKDTSKVKTETKPYLPIKGVETPAVKKDTSKVKK